MPKNIEIELKFPLLNFSEVESTLNEIAQFKYQSYQYDHYFNPPHRNFLSDKDNVCEWLRLRKSKDKAEINYKDWQPHDQKIKTHCIEFETKLESFDNFYKILKALDFKDLIVVEKTRKVWELDDIEISADIVTDLGEFIELEYKGTIENVEDARNYLFSFLTKIKAKTKEIDLKGYPFLLLEKQQLL